MRLKPLICAIAMCASALAFASAAPAYEVKTEAAPPDPVDNGVVYGVEETEEYGFTNTTGVVVGICAIAVIGVAAGYAIIHRKRGDMTVEDRSNSTKIPQEDIIPAVFKDRECDVHIEDKPDGTADLVIISKDAYWTDTFPSHAKALEFALRYGFKVHECWKKANK